jgi:hypothetical protein
MLKRKILKFKNFQPISRFLKKFNLKSFNNKNKVREYTNFFELSYLLNRIREDKYFFKHPKFLRTVKSEKKPHSYELDDLCRLHWIVLSRKVMTTLEFGSGFSTIFMADACFILSNYFKRFANETRVEKKFHIFSLDESSKFFKITKKRITRQLSSYITLIKSAVHIVEYQNKFATKYLKIPDITPGLIYLDGPSTFLKKRYKGFSFNNISRFPMSADILYIEYFLEPGTVIVVDGRTANARFLKDHLKRKWKYYHDRSGDCHYFELMESSLGPYNKRKIDFCLGDKIKFF